jgi:hypothetical protein
MKLTLLTRIMFRTPREEDSEQREKDQNEKRDEAKDKINI